MALTEYFFYVYTTTNFLISIMKLYLKKIYFKPPLDWCDNDYPILICFIVSITFSDEADPLREQHLRVLASEVWIELIL